MDSSSLELIVRMSERQMCMDYDAFLTQIFIFSAIDTVSEHLDIERNL